MNVWVVTFEEFRNYSSLIGVFDSQEKARAAARQYLKDLGYTDNDFDYDEDGISEYWSNIRSDRTMIIERTQIV